LTTPQHYLSRRQLGPQSAIDAGDLPEHVLEILNPRKGLRRKHAPGFP